MRKPRRPPASFAALVQAFFAEHLHAAAGDEPAHGGQPTAMPSCCSCSFAQVRLHKQPTAITLTDITPALILAFLDHLEHDRGKHGAQPQCPAGGAARIPEVRRPTRRDGAARRRAGARRADEALRAADARLPDPQRDDGSASARRAPPGSASAIICCWRMLYNTGARVSEIIGVRLGDVVLDGAPAFTCTARGVNNARCRCGARR